MSITIFEFFENTYEMCFDEEIERFCKFKERIKLVYHEHNISLVFTDYRECNLEWCEDDTLDWSFYPRNAIFRHERDFDMFLGIFANLTKKGSCQMLKHIYHAYSFNRNLKICTFFQENEEESLALTNFKSKLSDKIGNCCRDFSSDIELELEFIMQLRSINYHDETELKIIDHKIWLDNMCIGNVYQVPYLCDRNQCSEILDVIQFCMKLQNNYYYLCQFDKITSLLKQNLHEEVDRLLNYEETHAEVRELIKRYNNNEVITDSIRERVFISIDKLKIIALNSLVLNYENPNRIKEVLKYYKERYELSTKSYMPLYVVAQVALDYAQALFDVKQYKRAISILEECIKQHIKELRNKQSGSVLISKYRGNKRHSDFTREHRIIDSKAKLYLARLQETTANYYMMRKMYEDATEMYIKSIKSYSAIYKNIYSLRGEIKSYRSKIASLYSKLGYIYEIEIKNRDRLKQIS